MTLTDALKEAMTKAGFEDIEVGYVQTEEHSLRWKRSYTWIEFKVPEAMRELPDEAAAEVADHISTYITTGVNTLYSPDTVLAMRKTTGWPLEKYDDMGHYTRQTNLADYSTDDEDEEEDDDEVTE